MKRILMFLTLMGLMMHQAAAATVKEEWQLDTHPLKAADFFKKSMHQLTALHGFQCQFDQMMVFSDGGAQHYSGSLAILKPNHFRWEYKQPYTQLYLGDGHVIWHYEPDLMQAERLTNLESVDPAVMRLLNGTVQASDVKILKHEMDTEHAIHRFQVSIAQSPAIWLGFSSYGDLMYTERQDLMGNRNQMILSKCDYVAPAANLFSFTPPDGVDVLGVDSPTTHAVSGK